MRYYYILHSLLILFSWPATSRFTNHLPITIGKSTNFLVDSQHHSGFPVHYNAGYRVFPLCHQLSAKTTTTLSPFRFLRELKILRNFLPVGQIAAWRPRMHNHEYLQVSAPTEERSSVAETSSSTGNRKRAPLDPYIPPKIPLGLPHLLRFATLSSVDLLIDARFLSA